MKLDSHWQQQRSGQSCDDGRHTPPSTSSHLPQRCCLKRFFDLIRCHLLEIRGLLSKCESIKFRQESRSIRSDLYYDSTLKEKRNFAMAALHFAAAAVALDTGQRPANRRMYSALNRCPPTRQPTVSRERQSRNAEEEEEDNSKTTWKRLFEWSGAAASPGIQWKANNYHPMPSTLSLQSPLYNNYIKVIEFRKWTPSLSLFF